MNMMRGNMLANFVAASVPLLAIPLVASTTNALFLGGGLTILSQNQLDGASPPYE